MIRRKKGFTLIELLVVIAIIAILAAILFPVFAGARESSRQAACASHLKQVAIAFTMYTNDNQGRYPQTVWGTAYTPLPNGQAGFVRWPWALFSYAKTWHIFFCPSENKGWANRVESDPMFGYSFGTTPSWGYNWQFFSPGADELAPHAPPYDTIKDGSVTAPANTILLAESCYVDAGSKTSSLKQPTVGYFEVNPPKGLVKSANWTNSTSPITQNSYGGCWPRHKGLIANVAFADGHVAGMTLSKLSDQTLWGVVAN